MLFCCTASRALLKCKWTPFSFSSPFFYSTTLFDWPFSFFFLFGALIDLMCKNCPHFILTLNEMALKFFQKHFECWRFHFVCYFTDRSSYYIKSSPFYSENSVCITWTKKKLVREERWPKRTNEMIKMAWILDSL